MKNKCSYEEFMKPEKKTNEKTDAKKTEQKTDAERGFDYSLGEKVMHDYELAYKPPSTRPTKIDRNFITQQIE